MAIYPEEYKQELPGILDWFDDRACIRKGSWLGTEFPYKNGWIIEPISDSTLYPAYYLISHYVNNGTLTPEDMTEEFFDYVFLGKGEQKGKEKISKSKGGAEHVAEAAKIYGIDAMRLYYAHVGSPFVDIEWDADAVYKYKNKILNLYSFISSLRTLDKPPHPHLDTWIQTMMQRRIHTIRTNFDIYNLRVAANEIFFEMQKDIQWYIKRGGGNKQIIEQIVTTLIQLMTPFTPHLSEELWHMNHSSFVSTERYPTFNQSTCSDASEVNEYLIQQLLNDTQEILKVTGISPKKICFYTSPQWKQDLYKKAITLEEQQELNIGILMKDAMTNPNLRTHSKEISKIAGKLAREVKKLNASDRKRYLTEINEQEFLTHEKSFLEQTFSCTVEIYSSDDEKRYDPAGKARFADPLRPAIYVE